MKWEDVKVGDVLEIEFTHDYGENKIDRFCSECMNIQDGVITMLDIVVITGDVVELEDWQCTLNNKYKIIRKILTVKNTAEILKEKHPEYFL